MVPKSSISYHTVRCLLASSKPGLLYSRREPHSVYFDDPLLEELGEVVDDGEADGGGQQVRLFHSFAHGVADGDVALHRHGDRQIGRAHPPDVQECKDVGETGRRRR